MRTIEITEKEAKILISCLDNRTPLTSLEIYFKLWRFVFNKPSEEN